MRKRLAGRGAEKNEIRLLARGTSVTSREICSEVD